MAKSRQHLWWEPIYGQFSRGAVRPNAMVPPCTDAGRASSLIRVVVVGEPSLGGECLAVALAAEAKLNVVAGGLEEAVGLPDLGSATEVILLNGEATTARVVADIGILKETRPSSRILVLATHAEPGTIAAFLQAGAWGYVDRDKPLGELLVAINQVTCGNRHFSSEHVFQSLQSAPAAGAQVVLTARERQVLQATADGLTADEAAVQLHMATPTFRTHLRRAMVKLQARTRIHAVMLALKRGLIRLPETEPGARSPEANESPLDDGPVAPARRGPSARSVGEHSWTAAERNGGQRPIRLLAGSPRPAEVWRDRAGRPQFG